MLPKERMKIVFDNKIPDRVPFVPTIYEHAAKLINKTPSEVACSEDLLVESQLKAYEIYKHDLVVVGMDVYNIEAEALGCSIKFFDNENLPGVANHILGDDKNKLYSLKIPDPNRDGRMMSLINASKRVKNKIGEEVLVSSAIIGPFTLASLLRGSEKFIFDMMEEEKFAKELLRFTREVGLRFGAEFVKRGIGVAINDSWISPPMLSPSLYKKFVFPEHKKLINGLKKKGLDKVSLISGGDTTSIAKMLMKTGTSLLLVDSNADLNYFKELSQRKLIVLRGTVSPKTIEAGIESKIREETKEVISKGAPNGRFIIGCGVVSYNTSSNDLLKFKKAVEDFSIY